MKKKVSSKSKAKKRKGSKNAPLSLSLMAVQEKLGLFSDLPQTDGEASEHLKAKPLSYI